MKIFIPSRARAAQKWHTIDALLEARIPAEMVVGMEDRVAYSERFGADNVLVLPKRVVGIGKVRQHLIDISEGPVLMLDDDLSFFVRRKDDPKLLQKAVSKDIQKMVAVIREQLTVFAHAAIGVREGANRNTDRFIYSTRCLRALGYNADILKAEKVKFDRLPVMEDFDVALQLLRKGYPSCTLNHFLQDQGASNAPGGCSTYRSMEVQAEGAEGLARLHPAFVTVVDKEAKGAGEWATRKDVRIQWKKALAA